MGRMTIRVEGEPHGMTNVNVEEYKRPKFQVVLEPPKTAAKLGDTVEPPGQGHGLHRQRRSTGPRSATAWSARCVIRSGGCWCYWWRSPQTASQEIAHGTAITQSDGTFPVEFVAKPDLSVPEKDEPIVPVTRSMPT